ncbi:MAG: Asp-tRNA(Asn)/Glu-tRNA(Gln) amidotransferase A subunit family amidase [Rhodothermales bacterium]|jgi:Asp-tRNA(Asn)/Glu-tRNA(Gln) amidotransferase A subunit family amidase
MPEDQPVSRRVFLGKAATLGVAGAVAPLAVGVSRAATPESAAALPAGPAVPRALSVQDIQGAERVAGVTFTPSQREAMLEPLEDRLEVLEDLHAAESPNSLIPAQRFDPQIAGDRPRPPQPHPEWTPQPATRPSSLEDLAFQPVHVLASLLRSRQVTSTELTQLYLERLKHYDSVLHCVVNLTEERALAQARAADAELDAGLWRGPLHGVPWGAKDLLSVRGYPTTWGATPFKDQVIDDDASVVERLDAAGAVLLAKLTTGALAWGDVWFGGKTLNPWNIEQGSSGSSAGPGSAVAAGLVGFAIGSETLGSIVSPSTRNAVSGFRPTFGRISRAGAMTLSWSLDKLGPMCRSAFDCALVFDAVHGQDDRDPSSLDADFAWPLPVKPSRVRIGYVADAFEGDFSGAESDRAVLDVLRSLGFDPQPMAWPDVPTGGPMLALGAETAAAFDELSRTGGTDSMVSQQLWPSSFREARFITAVDYVNGQRQRTRLMHAVSEVMADYDVIVTNHRRNGLSITNLTGHPSVTVPNRLDPIENAPESGRRRTDAINFIGGLYQDDVTLAVAHAYQTATDFHLQRPPIK